MGIMGNFLVSNFSLDVLTQSPLGLCRTKTPNDFCRIAPAGGFALNDNPLRVPHQSG
jgi:hypothetical protein